MGNCFNTKFVINKRDTSLQTRITSIFVHAFNLYLLLSAAFLSPHNFVKSLSIVNYKCSSSAFHVCILVNNSSLWGSTIWHISCADNFSVKLGAPEGWLKGERALDANQSHFSRRCECGAVFPIAFHFRFSETNFISFFLLISILHWKSVNVIYHIKIGAFLWMA